MIEFEFHCEGVDIRPKRVSDWLKSVAADYGYEVGMVTYCLCDDAEVLQINQTYLHHNYLTDIITFDYTQGQRVNGDIFISVDTVRRNAQTWEEGSIDGMPKELYRVIVHGLLHLMGQGDKSPAEFKQMKQKEDKALVKLLNLIEDE